MTLLYQDKLNIYLTQWTVISNRYVISIKMTGKLRNILQKQKDHVVYELKQLEACYYTGSMIRFNRVPTYIYDYIREMSIDFPKISHETSELTVLQGAFVHGRYVPAQPGTQRVTVHKCPPLSASPADAIKQS